MHKRNLLTSFLGSIYGSKGIRMKFKKLIIHFLLEVLAIYLPTYVFPLQSVRPNCNFLNLIKLL